MFMLFTSFLIVANVGASDSNNGSIFSEATCMANGNNGVQVAMICPGSGGICIATMNCLTMDGLLSHGKGGSNNGKLYSITGIGDGSNNGRYFSFTVERDWKEFLVSHLSCAALSQESALVNEISPDPNAAGNLNLSVNLDSLKM